MKPPGEQSRPSWRERARLWRWGTWQLLRHGAPSVCFRFDGGIGDTVMMTAVLQAYRQRHPRARIWVITDHPALLARHPDCANALRPDAATIGLLRRLRVPITPLHYATHDPAGERDLVSPGHLIATMARQAGLPEDIARTPRVYLTAEELRAAAPAQGAICIQSTASNARYPIATKEWGSSRFAAVSAELSRQGLRLIQLGVAEDPRLPGVEDWRGRTSLRETAALLARSRLFIGLVGGLMHLARAVECPAVIVYGGRESPQQSGYPEHIHLVRTPSCSPCWLIHRCPRELECLTAIEPAEVVAAVLAELARTASTPVARG